MIDILKGSTAGQGRKTSWMKWINKALTARTGSNIDLIWLLLLVISSDLNIYIVFINLILPADKILDHS